MMTTAAFSVTTQMSDSTSMVMEAESPVSFVVTLSPGRGHSGALMWLCDQPARETGVSRRPPLK